MFKEIYSVVITTMYNKDLKCTYQVTGAHTTVEGAYHEILSIYDYLTKKHPDDDIQLIDSKDLVFIHNVNNGEEVWEYRIKKIVLIED